MKSTGSTHQFCTSVSCSTCYYISNIDFVVLNKPKPRVNSYHLFDRCLLSHTRPRHSDEHLLLSECNRKVSYTEEKQPYPDHPERFNEEHQVLCREGLTGRCYWEVEWEGFVEIGVAYKSLQRKGHWDTQIKLSEKAWCFFMATWNGYSFLHRRRQTFIPVPVIDVKAFLSRQRRLGLFLDWSTGILSFYSLSGDTKTLLHTIHTTFSEPLHPVFYVSFASSLTLSRDVKPKTINVSISGCLKIGVCNMIILDQDQSLSIAGEIQMNVTDSSTSVCYHQTICTRMWIYATLTKRCKCFTFQLNINWEVGESAFTHLSSLVML